MSWKQFQFFEGTPIKDPNLGTDQPLYSDPTLTSIVATEAHFLISINNSVVKIIDQDFQLVKQFQAYEKAWSITYMSYLPKTGLFATIAERQGQPSSLKLWNLSKVLKTELIDDSSYHTTVDIKNSNHSYPITCFSHSLDYAIWAFGFANGDVILVRGDLLRDRGSSQTTVYKSSDPITSVNLEQKNNYDPELFISTTSSIFTVSTIGGNNNRPNKILDKLKGADLKDVIIDENDHLIVARNEGLIIYSKSGYLNTISIDMFKKQIFKFDKYILIITLNTTNSSSLIMNGYSEPTKIVIIDIEQNLVSFSYTITTGVSNIFKMWNDVYLMLSDGVLFKIHEKSIDDQLDIIIKRELYPIAIELLENNNKRVPNDTSLILDIKKQYGDYLYDKDETTLAMEQYIQAITNIKTSEIIKKYKDSKEVLNLSKFLKKMIELNLATKDHITLLLCCYCKLKDEAQLNEFIENYLLKEDDDMKIEFDLDTVVEICKETDFLVQASHLAQILKNPSLSIDILLRDLNDPSSAIDYIKTLPIDETLRILIEYTSLLLNELPNQTTSLLIDVFTGKYKPKKTTSTTNIKKNGVSSNGQPVLLQSYKAFMSYMVSQQETDKDKDEKDEGEEESQQLTYQPPRPRVIFPSFINKQNEFVIFLEAILENFDRFEGNENDKKDIINTLYEMYLTLGSQDLENKEKWEQMAIELIRSNSSLVDKSSILMISNIFDFDEGKNFSHEGPGFEIDLFRSCVATRNINEVENILNKYGEKEPELYPLALMFYTSSEEIFNQIGIDKFKLVLNKIVSKRILSALEIIQILSINKIATIDIIKDYIIEFIEREQNEIKINEKLCESYKEEVIKKQELISKFDNLSIEIQLKNCNICSNKLDSEIVHFMCDHSYHKLCLIEPDNCPICTPTRDSITNIRKAQLDIGERNDLFNIALKDTDHRFKVVTDFFGKGAMECVNYELSNDEF